MKRWLVLMLAAGTLLIGAASASAVEFRPSGWISVGFFASNNLLGSYGAFQDHDSATVWGDYDYEPTRYQFKLQYGLNLDFIASEQLSGSIQFRGANKHFGRGSEFDGNWNRSFFVHRAFIDWYIPNTPVEVRMGRWHEGPKTFSVGINHLTSSSNPQDGVRIKARINDNISVSGIWWRRSDERDDFSDLYNNGTADQFSLHVPMNFNGVEISPWISYVRDNGSFFSGPDSSWGVNINTAHYATFDGTAFAPLGAGPDGLTLTWRDSRVWLAGIGVRFATFSPFVVELDFSYSNLKVNDVLFYGTPGQGVNAPDAFNRKGWVIGGRVSFGTDFGTPALVGWYSSGDDDNVSNGSERPVNTAGGKAGLYSMFGSDRYSRLELGEDAGFVAAGTWALSLQLTNASFVLGLNQSIALTYIRGTNDPIAARYQFNYTPGMWPPQGSIRSVSPQKYMTTNDSAIALELYNSYQIYKELTVAFDMFYIWQRFDQDTWSLMANPAYNGTNDQFIARYIDQDGEMVQPEFSNAWGIGLSFNYSF